MIGFSVPVQETSFLFEKVKKSIFAHIKKWRLCNAHIFKTL